MYLQRAEMYNRPGHIRNAHSSCKPSLVVLNMPANAAPCLSTEMMTIEELIKVELRELDPVVLSSTEANSEGLDNCRPIQDNPLFFFHSINMAENGNRAMEKPTQAKRMPKERPIREWVSNRMVRDAETTVHMSAPSEDCMIVVGSGRRRNSRPTYCYEAATHIPMQKTQVPDPTSRTRWPRS